MEVPGSLPLFGVATAALSVCRRLDRDLHGHPLARNMPQFGLMSILVLLPLQILSGAPHPRESMPELVRGDGVLRAHHHYVSLAQSVAVPGRRAAVVWPQLLMVAADRRRLLPPSPTTACARRSARCRPDP